jgi:hypothetical protein
LEPRVFVPIALRQLLLREVHDAPGGGHLGRDKTLERLQRLYFWPGMDAAVAAYVRSCPSCQAAKASTQLPVGLLQPLPVPERPWASVSLDFVAMPRSRSGFDRLLVIVDRLTKMVKLAPTTATATAPDVAQLYVDNVIRLGFGVPTSLVSDRDVLFTSRFWGALQAKLGTALAMSTAFHPQSDGQTERANRTVKEMLRSRVNARRDDWDEHLAMVEFAYNDSVNASTGFSPFYLNLGRHPRVPWCLDQPSAAGSSEAADVFAERLRLVVAAGRASVLAAQERMARLADRRRRAGTFAVGDLVWLSSANMQLGKLAPKYLGPFPVADVVSPVAMRLQLPPALGNRHPTFHVSLLRPFVPSTFAEPREAAPPVVVLPGAGPEYYTVQAIRGQRLHRVGTGRRTQLQFLVKWEGYRESENSWEPAVALRESPAVAQLVADYAAAHPLERG